METNEHQAFSIYIDARTYYNYIHMQRSKYNIYIYVCHNVHKMERAMYIVIYKYMSVYVYVIRCVYIYICMYTGLRAMLDHLLVSLFVLTPCSHLLLAPTWSY